MRFWNAIELWLIGLLGTGALLVGTAQVIGRYVDRRFTFTYGDEVVVYLTVWAVFLACSQLVRTDGHVRPDVMIRLLPIHAQRWVEAFNCVVAIVFCCGLAWYAGKVVAEAVELDERSITGLEFPMWGYYASLLAGGLLMLARYLVRLHRLLFRFDPSGPVIAVSEH